MLLKEAIASGSFSSTKAEIPKTEFSGENLEKKEVPEEPEWDSSEEEEEEEDGQ